MALFTFYNSAPPTTIIMTAGEEGSIYQKYALQYKKILAKQGVNLTILSSDVSIENLKKLADKHTNIDVGFLQSGLAECIKIDALQ